jgi:hypothetical protein
MRLNGILKTLLFLSVAINSLLSFSQKTIFPLDTLEKNNKKIILFSNNRWLYLDEYYASIKRDSMDVYSKNWETKDIFAYLSERGKPIEYAPFDMTSLEPDNFILPRCGKLFRGFENHHTGLDIGLKMGDSVVAAFDGRVRYAQYHSRGYGNMVIIRHANGLETWYAHLSKIIVHCNDEVESGQLIGLGGMTGRATSPHLHLEARYHDKPFDPQSFIDLEHHCLRDDIFYQSSYTNGKQTHHKKNTDSLNSVNAALPKVIKIKPDKGKNKSSSRTAHTHTIKFGETLFGIAKQNHTSVQAICEANHITVKTVLNPGRKLIIP